MALFILMALLCLHPVISSPLGLVLGLIYGLLFTHPFPRFNQRYLHRFLAASIIGIGFGVDLNLIAEAGMQGFGYTLMSILFTMALGLGIGRWLGVSTDLSLLICSGTAICGGSAIAAIASVRRAPSRDVSTALAIIFVLNSIALLVFPSLGHWFGLDQKQFGLWSALAIHDTSSVVGATMRFGSESLNVGTTVKLARTLWIIPLAFAIGIFFKPTHDSANHGSLKKPWFILGFIGAAFLTTWVPSLHEPAQWIATSAKRLFVLTLFLIGTGFNRENLKNLSLKPVLQATLLWACIGSLSLLAIGLKWI